tara:strand:+ start:163 stop:363 length:201 start_codon:yes stop_codon:yes gene_type:complete
MILKNIKNLLPYLLLIAIYFFFVNLEARKETIKIKGIDGNEELNNGVSNLDDKQLRIKIPVIPYKQ